MKSGIQSGRGTEPSFSSVPFAEHARGYQEREPKDCDVRCVPPGYIQPEGGLFMSSALSLLVPRLSLTLQDGRWVPEEKMAASLRDTDEPSAWFRFSA